MKEKIISKRNIDKLIVAIVFIFVFIFCMVRFFQIWYKSSFGNADYALYIVCGKDIFKGNFLLKGWYGATNSFYFLSFLYGLLGLVFGYKLELIAIVSSLFYSIMSSITCYIVLRYDYKSTYEKYVKVFMCLALILSSCYCNSLQEHSVYAGAHFDVMIISVVAFMLLSQEIKYVTPSWGKIIVLYFVLFLETLSDSLVLIFAIIPIVLVLFIRLLLDQENKKRFLMLNLLMVISIVVLSRIVSGVLNTMGTIKVNGAESLRIVDISILGERLLLSLEEVLYLFGGDFWGQALVRENIPIFISALLLILLFFLLFWQGLQIEDDLFLQFVIMMVIVLWGVFVFADYALKDGVEYASRLAYPIFWGLILIFAKIDLQRIIGSGHINARLIINCILVVTSVIFVLSFKGIQNNFDDYKEYKNKYDLIADVLEEKQVKYGYATYWLSHPVTIESDFEIQAVPITGEYPKRFFWNSQELSGDSANFIIYEEGGFGGITQERIDSVIGIPDDIIKIDDITICIWEVDISPYILNFDNEKEIIECDALSKSEGVKVDISNNYIIEPGEYAYGPYILESEGNYKITFYGEGLEKVDVDVFSSTLELNEILIEQSFNKVTSKVVEINCSLPRDVEDFEVRLFNESSETVILDKVLIEKMEE